MSKQPKKGEVYKHFKGNRYEIITVAEHSETGEELVIYQALYGEGKIYARPLTGFVEKLPKDKYPDAKQEYRFELQEKKEDNIPPLIMEFLDADTYDLRLEILDKMKPNVTDEMINTMAVVCDVEVPEGEITQRFENLRNCLITLRKYECNRLR